MLFFNEDMNKRDWENLYMELDRIYASFIAAYPDYDNKRHITAVKHVDEAIDAAQRLLKVSDELRELLLGKNASASYEAFYYEGFTRPDIFKSDMPALMDKVKTKIASFS